MAGLGRWELHGALDGGGPDGPVGSDTTVNSPLHPKLRPGRGARGALAHIYLGKRGSCEEQETHRREALWETGGKGIWGNVLKTGTWGDAWG